MVKVENVKLRLEKPIDYTKAKILGDDGNSYDVICFGPISVLPEFQGKGIGGMLIKHTKNLAKQLGYRAILIYGDPEYYSRYNFVPAETYGIGTPDNMYAVPLQSCELYSESLQNCQGRFFEDKIFEIDEIKAVEFDKQFPKKEKQSTLASQERFSKLVGMRKPRKGMA